MTFATRLTKVGNGREHFDQRTRMCYHKVPPSERVVAQVGDAGQAKPHREHHPLSLLGARLATPIRKLNDPEMEGYILDPPPRTRGRPLPFVRGKAAQQYEKFVEDLREEVDHDNWLRKSQEQ